MRGIKLALFAAFSRRPIFLAVALAMAFCVQSASAQVSPSEILNPDLKALEQSYFQQLKSLNQSITKTKFPFPFYLSRFVGLDPSQQAEADSRGMEFVRFQDRVILKITGNYNAAYDTARLTQNERAAGTFRAVVLPILGLVTSALPEDLPCDGVGFEISHHTHSRERSYEYEGKEILVVVLDRNDAWALSRASADPERQGIVNRSKVYVSGIEFGLALSERDPLNVQTLPRSVPAKPDATSTARSSSTMGHSPLLNSKLLVPSLPPVTLAPAGAVPPSSDATQPSPKAADPPITSPPPTQADADALGEKYQAQLAALAKEGATKFHFVEYAPPTFVVFRSQMALQITLRNTIQFVPVKGSIYKRAAQTFDLFLAPQLRDLSDKISPGLEFQLFDFSVLNRIAPGVKGTSEAIEFICPQTALRQFVNAEITNQQLLDQSVILVNGVRIVLNLQLVE
ncbi:MAG: hypothetical protein ACHQLQ_06565 [Candidatus Acidiferrales bacterium]